MGVMDRPEQLAFVGFLVCAMVGIGLRTEWAEVRELFARRGTLARALLANFVLAPLLGLVIVRTLPLPAGPAAALLMLACVPGGLSAVQFTRKAKGEEAMAGTLMVLLSGLAILVSPPILRMVLPHQADPQVPYLRVAAIYAGLLLAPLAAGMGLVARWPRLSEHLPRVLGVATTLLFVTFMLSAKSFRKEAVATIGMPAVAAMLLFIVLTMAVGWYLGGPDRSRRQVFASTTSMRNAALAMAIARDSRGGEIVMPALIAFSLLMVTPNTLFTLWQGLRKRRRAPAKS